jgi:hypothetical protein
MEFTGKATVKEETVHGVGAGTNVLYERYAHGFVDV